MGTRSLASSKPTGRGVATVTAAVAIVGILPVGLYSYVAGAGRNVLNQTLIAQRDGTSLPANVVFDARHLSEHMQAEGRFAALLKDGFAVGPSTFLWDAPHLLGASYSVEVEDNIGLVCEVYRGKAWRVSCGQLRCVKGDPCRFESAR
jgi:hypothetical protein